MTGVPFARAERGVALIAVLLIASLLSVTGLGLALTFTVGRLVARNHLDAAVLEAAAHAGIDLAAGALADADWDAVLSGLEVADGVDGLPSGVRSVDGTAVDLDAETNLLNCARPTACSPAERSAVTTDRPWGANNPHWRAYLFGPISSFGGFRHGPPVYLVVWIGDDGREVDGRPDLDGSNGAGRHLLRVRAMALGQRGARRVRDAELVRVCTLDESMCEPGIRVQSERDVRHALP